MGYPGLIVEGDGTHSDLYGTIGDDAMMGTALAEIFHSGLGNDFVFGGAGDDTVRADLGDDRFDGGPGNDLIDFSSYADDQAMAPIINDIGVKFDLAITKAQNLGYFGHDSFTNFENVGGGAGNDKLYGNAGANGIGGNNGNDYLDGRGGNDRLDGGFGADTLVGGAGADTEVSYHLIEDDARDVFKYLQTSDSGTTDATRDFISGAFNHANHDVIDLSAIDANGSFKSGNGKFTFIGDHAFSKGTIGEVQVKATANHLEYLVSIDTDKDNSPEMTILVQSVYGTALVKSDFIL